MGGSAKYRAAKKAQQNTNSANNANQNNNAQQQNQQNMNNRAVNMLQKRQQRLQQQQQKQQQAQQQQASSTSGSATYDNFMKMTDDEKAAFITQAVGTKGSINQLPILLQKGGENRAQKYAYALDLNAKPTLLSSQEFQQFMKDNNIPKSEMLTQSRGNPNSLTSYMTSDYNYLGGRNGGDVHGDGQYFAKSGGHNTGYGGYSMNAVLNPKTAKVVNESQLQKIYNNFSPALKKVAANRYGEINPYMVATIAGYNVIRVDKGYHAQLGYTVVLDRSATVVENRIF